MRQAAMQTSRLALVGLAAGGVLLAGCSSGGSAGSLGLEGNPESDATMDAGPMSWAAGMLVNFATWARQFASDPDSPDDSPAMPSGIVSAASSRELEVEKVDLKKELGWLYRPTNREWELVDVPRLQFLIIDGRGDPNTASDYREAVEALYALSYALKFMSKKELDRDFTVMPLEGLWTSDGHEGGHHDKAKYRWTMMVMQPDWITDVMVAQAIAAMPAKKPLPALPRIRFDRYDEGLSLQLLHLGSYDDEAPKLARLHAEVMPAGGLAFNGLHHEIYLSDPRKTDAGKLKTILRQPVTRA